MESKNNTPVAKEPQNLMSGLLEEMNRVRDLKAEYDRLPDNAGFLGSAMMQIDIKRAEQSIITGDVVEMLMSFKKLKECTG